MNLFCFPFAGGGRHSYKGYITHAPPDIHIIPLELPGRGRRVNEPLLTNITDVTEDCWKQLKYRLNSPYALYGHSMGALMAHLVTHTIIREGYPMPRYLFLTGSKAPSVREQDSTTHSLPSDAFWNTVTELGGFPEDTPASMLDFFEPILRADFEVASGFRYMALPPYPIPITVLTGTEEPISLDDVRAWQKETLASVEVRQLPGRHFFIFQHEKEIMQLIQNRLRRFSMSGRSN